MSVAEPSLRRRSRHRDAARRRRDDVRPRAHHEDRAGRSAVSRRRRRRRRTSAAVPIADGRGLAGKTVLRSDHRERRDEARRRCADRQGGHSGRIGIPAARALAEGRDGPDAADAEDGAAIRRRAIPTIPRATSKRARRYLKQLLDEFELPLALAAYNAGEGAVRRFGGIPPYAETQAYVAKILAAA